MFTNRHIFCYPIGGGGGLINKNNPLGHCPHSHSCTTHQINVLNVLNCNSPGRVFMWDLKIVGIVR